MSQDTEGGAKDTGYKKRDVRGDSVPSPISHHSLGFQVLEENHFLEIYASLSLSLLFLPSICLSPSFSVSISLFFIWKKNFKGLEMTCSLNSFTCYLGFERTVTPKQHWTASGNRHQRRP